MPVNDYETNSIFFYLKYLVWGVACKTPHINMTVTLQLISFLLCNVSKRLANSHAFLAQGHNQE